MTTIKLGNFNELEADAVKKFIKSHNLDEVFEVADAKRMYWQNNDSTLVLRVRQDGRGLTFHDGIALGELTRANNADEFDSTVEDYRTYYRIWWD